MKIFLSKNKISFSILIIVVAILILVINKISGPKLTINLKELYQDNQIIKNDENSKLKPIFNENYETTTDNFQESIVNQDFSEGNKATITKPNLNYKDKKKTSLTQNIKVPVLYCQDIKDKFPFFWIKEGALYGEFLSKGVRLALILKDDCLWMWILGKKNGLKVCSSDLNLDFLNNIDLDKIDKKTIEEIKKEVSNFDCSKNYVEEKKFLPPSNIEFFLINDEIRNYFKIL